MMTDQTSHDVNPPSPALLAAVLSTLILLLTAPPAMHAACMVPAQQEHEPAGESNADDEKLETSTGIAIRAPKSPSAAVAELLRILNIEGEMARDELQLPRNRANVAADFPFELPLEQLGRMIIQPHNRDPLIDGYIRWQLTSFDPPLPKMSERQFEQVIEKLPRLLENPRADRQLLNQVNRAVQVGRVPPRDVERFEQMLDELAGRTSQMQSLNLPAESLRDWLGEQFEDQPLRVVVLLMERCGAAVQAGWPANKHIEQVEAELAKCVEDDLLEPAERRHAGRFTQRLSNIERLYVAAIRINEGAVEAEFVNTAVYDYDVRRWLRLLEKSDDLP